MGWFIDQIDRLTGASRRERRRITAHLAATPTLSRHRAERLAEKIGEPLPDTAQRRWEAAKSNRLNHAHWANVDGQPINASLAWDSADLRNRCEYEVCNNALALGMAWTYDLCVVGSQGPELQVMTEDEKYQQAREKVWSDWFAGPCTNPQISGVDLLDSWIHRLFGCGEFTTQIVSDGQAEGPVQLRLLQLHPHRLLTPPHYLGDPAVALGVRRDVKWDRPLTYYVSQPWIFGPYEVYTGEFAEIPFRDFLHGFVRLEEYQVRGVPWLATCLDTLADLRDFKFETLDAARSAADWAVYLSTQHPDAPYLQVNEITAVERRTIRHAPPGWQPNMVAPAHPGPEFVPFYESLAREVGRPVCMPLMMLLLDSSKHNYSSARFDAQLYWRHVGKTQGWVGRQLFRLEAMVAREAELAGALPPPPKDLKRSWVWPYAPTIDPTKEIAAEQQELQVGTADLFEICARHNRRLPDVVAKRKRANEMLKTAGLPEIPGIQAKPAPGEPGVFGGEKEDTEGKDDGKPTATKPPPLRAGKPANGNGAAKRFVLPL